LELFDNERRKTMPRKTLVLASAVILGALAVSSKAQAWGAYRHVGYTHNSSYTGLHHYGYTEAYRGGGYGGYDRYGYGGYHYGSSGSYGRYYGGYHYGYGYGSDGAAYGAHYGYYRAW
jgi:hypothetical protein